MNIYRHYKGDLYNVFTMNGRVESNPEVPMVIYKSLELKNIYGEDITWVRPKSEFEAQVLLEDGTLVERFKKIELNEDFFAQ